MTPALQKISRYCLSICVAVAMTGCGKFIEKRAAESTYSVMVRSKKAVQRADDVELARAAAPGGLVQLEAFHLAYPFHKGFVGLLAEGYCQYASGFLRDDWEVSVLANDGKAERLQKRTLRLLDRCIGYGLQLLGKRWQTAHASSPDAMAPLIKKAKKSHIAGMTWVAIGLSTAIGMNPFDVSRAQYLGVAQQLLDRIIALDAGHQDATAHVIRGAIDSSRPAIIGGNPAAGLRHFERARALTKGSSLMIDVVLARTYAVATKNRALFRKTLNAVLTADVSKWPDRRLTNEMAIAKARVYLAAEAKLFGDSPVSKPRAAKQ